MSTPSVLSQIILVALFVAAPALQVHAQDSPDPAAATQQVDLQQTERIVDGRPSFYTARRALHPLTWLEAGTEPLFRSASEGRIYALTNRKRNPHLDVGVAGNGTGSGFGPLIKPHTENLLGTGIQIEVPLLYTYKRYEAYRFNARFPLASDKLFARKITFDLGARYASNAEDEFFGIGNQTPRGDERFAYRSVTRDASAGFTAKLNDFLTAGIHGVYRNVGITDPRSGDSAQDHFDSSVPGLFTGGAFRSIVASLAHHGSSHENYEFKGGSQLLEVSLNDSAGKGAFSYWRYHFEAQQFFPLTNDGRKVIAVRGLVETNRPKAGNSVPFFDMPFLGTSSTLRGFENFRFRDRSAIAMSLEYRYRIHPQLDWGFFVDEGQVGPELGDMGWSRFHGGYGIRFFVWPKSNVPISIDYGFSREASRLYINFNTTF